MAVVALLMFGGGGGYRVNIELPNAGQLVNGNEVKVGGVPVGLVEDIELTDDARARIELSISDDELTPLPRGTVATVRASSLSGIANKYVALELGPNDAPEIEDGGAIPAEDARGIVDLDQVLNTLDPSTQADLRAATRASAHVFDDGAAEDINAGLEYLNPALSQSAATARELTEDQRALERLVVESADVVSAVASRPEDLDQLVSNALAATGELASESEALDASLRRLPPTLRRTNTTLVNVRALLDDLQPVINEARPAAPDLSRVLTRLQPIARDALPETRALQATIDRPGRSDDLLGVLRRLSDLEDVAVPAFSSTVQTVEDALPILQEARPYTPDVVGGLLNGFGGATGGYYDANGHYARISFQGTPYTLNNEGTLIPIPDGPQGLFGYRKGVTKRCPGAATQPAPDGSNPFTDGQDDVCDREDDPR
ncbi:MAG: MlaD family protein [Thermoleophilaceae bacterium]